jgi:hypothetical protein
VSLGRREEPLRDQVRSRLAAKNRHSRRGSA